MSDSVIIQAQELQSLLSNENIVIVDARNQLDDPEAAYKNYLISHIPGAVYAHLNRDLSDLTQKGLGRHPLPDEKEFTKKLGTWGITPSTKIVVYDAADGSMAAARFWWLVSKLLGHKDIQVLDGGLANWKKLGLTETSQVPEPKSLPSYPASFNRTLVVTSDEVFARLSDKSGWLLDARSSNRYQGENETIDPVAGHVPGALNWPFSKNIENGVFKSPEVLKNDFKTSLKTNPNDIVLMCGSGVTACHLLLAFEYAGLSGPKIFAGSWSGWISDPSHPTEKS